VGRKEFYILAGLSKSNLFERIVFFLFLLVYTCGDVGCSEFEGIEKFVILVSIQLPLVAIVCNVIIVEFN
jgi:hypothetical protein